MISLLHTIIKKISFETQKQNDEIFVVGSVHILFPQAVSVVAQFWR